MQLDSNVPWVTLSMSLYLSPSYVHTQTYTHFLGNSEEKAFCGTELHPEAAFIRTDTELYRSTGEGILSLH